MKLAAQLYTIREFTKDEQGIRESFKKIRDIGYNAVQISTMAKIDFSVLKEILDENSLQVCVSHTPIDDIVNETEKVIADHKLVGANYIGIGYYHSTKLEDWKDFCKKIEEPAKKIKQANLQLVYHHHEHEFSVVDGVRPIDLILANSNIGLLSDLYWAQYAGFNVVKFLNEYKDRIDIVHFKDLKVLIDRKVDTAEMFQGNMDYETIYKECLELGIKWACIEQDSCDGDPFESLKISFDNCKKRGMFL